MLTDARGKNCKILIVDYIDSAGNGDLLVEVD